MEWLHYTIDYGIIVILIMMSVVAVAHLQFINRFGRDAADQDMPHAAHCPMEALQITDGLIDAVTDALGFVERADACQGREAAEVVERIVGRGGIAFHIL